MLEPLVEVQTDSSEKPTSSSNSINHFADIGPIITEMSLILFHSDIPSLKNLARKSALTINPLLPLPRCNYNFSQKGPHFATEFSSTSSISSTSSNTSTSSTYSPKFTSFFPPVVHALSVRLNIEQYYNQIPDLFAYWANDFLEDNFSVDDLVSYYAIPGK